jgi:hypothetical protein
MVETADAVALLWWLGVTVVLHGEVSYSGAAAAQRQGMEVVPVAAGGGRRRKRCAGAEWRRWLGKNGEEERRLSFYSGRS